MRSTKPRYILHKLHVGLRGRCPECEQGKLFSSRLRMESACPYCGVRFSRHSGDMLGGLYLNIAATESTTLTGVLLLHTTTQIPLWTQMLIWIPYVVLFSVYFYPYARGLWVAVLYLLGAIYADPDYTREYFSAPSYTRQSYDLNESPENE